MNFPCNRCEAPTPYRRFKNYRRVWGYLEVRGMRFLASPPHKEGLFLCLACVHKAVKAKEDVHVVVTPDVLRWLGRVRGMKPRVLREAIGRRAKEKARDDKRARGKHTVWTSKAWTELAKREPWRYIAAISSAHLLMMQAIGMWVKEKSA